MGMMRMQTTCDHCGGKGKYPKSTCPVCRGRKFVTESKNFKVQIDRGIEDGHEIVFEGEGDAIQTALPGDVIISIRVAKNSKFERKGDDLYTKMNIDFEEALMGFDRNIGHLDGRLI